MGEPLAPPTDDQLRDLTDIAAAVGASGRRVRVVCADGRVFDAHALRPRYDHLVLTPRRGPALELPLASVVRLETARLRLGRALALGLGVVAAGVALGVLLIPRPGYDVGAGAALGGVAGAFIAPLVVFLVQGAPALRRWHVRYAAPAV